MDVGKPILPQQGESGIILVRTATLLLVGTYCPEMSPSICVEGVEKLG